MTERSDLAQKVQAAEAEIEGFADDYHAAEAKLATVRKCCEQAEAEWKATSGDWARVTFPPETVKFARRVIAILDGEGQ